MDQSSAKRLRCNNDDSSRDRGPCDRKQPDHGQRATKLRYLRIEFCRRDTSKQR